MEIPKSILHLINIITTDTVKPVTTQQACLHCGATLEDIQKASRLGCAFCYTQFREQLLPVIHNFQKSVLHVGKKPNKKFIASPEVELVNLQARMKAAIDREEYEVAAQIKKEIAKFNERSNP